MASNRLSEPQRVVRVPSPIHATTTTCSPTRPESIELATEARHENSAMQSFTESDDTTNKKKAETDNRSSEQSHPRMKSIAKAYFAGCMKPYTRIQRRMQKSGFSGWRMGILIGSCTSAFILCFNVVVVLVAYSIDRRIPGGLVDMISGSEESTSRWSTAIHLIINIFSTSLLAASNYTVQVLCSPTRADLDAAHAKGTWLDIGILSMRNLKYLPRARMGLAVLLGISSIPIHLFYNAAVFQVDPEPSPKFWAMEAGSSEWTAFSLESNIKKIWDNSWLDHYDTTELAVGLGDAHLVIDQFAFDLGQDATNISRLNYFPMILSRSNIQRQNLPWIEYPSHDPSSGHWPGDAPWPSRAHVAHVLVEFWDLQSQIQFSGVFMIVVICCNSLKLIIMLVVLFTHRAEHLVTLGDAAASYLQHPDPHTVRNCMLDQESCKFRSRVMRTPGRHVDEDAYGRSKGIWLPHRVSYAMQIPMDRKVFYILLLNGLITGIVLLPSTGPKVFQWGSNTSIRFDLGPNTPRAAWVANSPQVLLSLCYVVINDICTCMGSAEEWHELADGRKGLRVSRPIGEQRQTYFLQLPYKYAIPMITVSIALHWIMSQALSLRRRYTYRMVWVEVGNCRVAYSSLSLLVLLIVALIMLMIVGWVALKRRPQRLPLGASCSLVISAACHSPEIDAHLNKVKWGVIEGLDSEGFGHCCLTGKRVSTPEVGAKYR